MDTFTAAGLKKPGISILSDEFLEDVKALRRRNVAVELPRKLQGRARVNSKQRRTTDGRCTKGDTLVPSV